MRKVGCASRILVGKNVKKKMAHHLRVVDADGRIILKCIILSGRGMKADHSLPSSDEVKNERSYTSAHPYSFMACTAANLHLPYWIHISWVRWWLERHTGSFEKQCNTVPGATAGRSLNAEVPVRVILHRVLEMATDQIPSIEGDP
jgi:hypothetical protein